MTRKDVFYMMNRIAVYGMITLCLSNNSLTREDVYQDMDKVIDMLLIEQKSKKTYFTGGSDK